MSMRAGQLRHRIQLQSSTKTRNSQNERIETWETYDTVWGSVTPLRGEERLIADQIQSEVSHNIRIRFDTSTTVLPRHRAIHDGRIFQINSVEDVSERNRQRLLRCKELVT